MIPEGWRTSKLGGLVAAPISYGVVKPGDHDPNGVAFVRGGDFPNGKIEPSKLRTITRRVSDQYRRTQLVGGEILVSLVGYPGACAIVQPELAGANIARQAAVVRLNGEADKQYLFQFLTSPFGQSALLAKVIGSAQQVINLHDLREVPVPLPPLPEQRRIAEILGVWDRAIAAVEALIANARTQKQALMQSLLTGKHRLPGFTGEWKEIRLGDLADLFAGGTPSTARAEYWGGDIPWMSSGEINLREIYAVDGRITEVGLSSSSAKMVPLNSVLIALAGQGTTRGKVAISRIPLCTNQSVATIVPGSDLNSDYLFYNLDSRYDELRSLSLGDGGRGGLNLSILKSISVPAPAIDEQAQIASALRLADEQVALLEAKRAALRQEKSALMQQLLTGRRRVKLAEREDA